MYRVTVRGTYYEMGLAQGRSLRESGFSLPPPDKKMLRFAKQCEEVVGHFMPELLDELRGVADGAEIDYDTIMTLTTTAPFDPDEMPGCSVVAVMPQRTSDGRMIIGRNFDMIESGAGRREIRHPEDGLLILTNHAVCPALAGKDSHSEDYADSRARYSRLYELLHGETPIRVEDVKKAMCDHQAGVCRHKVDSSGRRDSTIWSVVARPRERQMDIADGHPCLAEYQAVRF